MTSSKNNYQLSEQDWARISEMWSWSLETNTDHEMLYHYYKGHTLKKVIKRDEIEFRLASSATFTDKMEGKAIEVYYDLALEELAKEKKISEELFIKLSEKEIPDKIPFMYLPDNGHGVYQEDEYEEYIICFSTAKNDPYMFETYSADSDGYCLHLYGIELKEIKNLGIKNHAEIKLIDVLYGREVVDYIKEKVYSIVSNPIRKEDLDYYIHDLLHYVQFAAKRKKYAREKEVRLVVFLPKNRKLSLPNIQFFIDRDLNRFIFFSIPNDMLCAVSPAPFNATEENSEIKSFLEDNGYQGTFENNTVGDEK